VRTGQPARVGVREYPGRDFAGTVTRAADELDPSTRTMNTEVRVPNADGTLIAGMYAEVSMTLPLSHRVVEIPATAVVNDAKGMRVLTVEADDHVHVVPVVVEQDNGATMDIASGLTGTERVVKLGTAELTEGTRVNVAH
jgi:membrane fusion protein, multidrug efflux system